MISGIIMEINDNKAVIFQDDGSFVSVSADSNWQIGDVISIEPATNKMNRQAPSRYSFVYKAAACLLILLVIGGFGSYRAYYSPTALISIDVNPSIELQLNIFDRVISYIAYNDEGEQIADLADIKNMKYEKAVETILSGDSLKDYTDDSSYFVFAVQTDNQKKEDVLYGELQKTAAAAISHHHSGAQAEYSIVDKTFVNEAHEHGLSPGKYKILLDLKEVSPDINIDNYCHDSIGTIKAIIDECSNHSGNASGSHGNSSTHGNSDTETDSDETNNSGSDTDNVKTDNSDDTSDSSPKDSSEHTGDTDAVLQDNAPMDSKNHSNGHGNRMHGGGHN